MNDDEPEDTVYFGGAWDASLEYTIGQGFEPMSHNGELRVSNMEWGKRRVSQSLST